MAPRPPPPPGLEGDDLLRRVGEIARVSTAGVVLAELLRVAMAVAALFLVAVRVRAFGALALAGVAVMAVVWLWPHGPRAPTALGTFKRRADARLGRLRWPVRGAASAAALAVWFLHPVPEGWPSGTVHVVLRTGVIPEKAALDPDGRHLFVTHGQGPGGQGGVSRYDLESGRSQNDRVIGGGHEIDLHPAVNRLYVPADDRRERTTLYAYSMHPFEALGTLTCDVTRIGRVAALDATTALVLVEDGSYAYLADPLTPCAARAGRRIELDSVWQPRWSTPLPGDPTVWISGEQGGRMLRVEPRSGSVVARAWSGPLILGPPLVRPGGAELWVPQSLTNAVRVHDSGSGRHLASIPVVGAPRAMAFSADGATAYVATYNSHRIALVDARERRVLRYVRGPYRVRSMFVDAPRDRLVTTSASGLHLIPIGSLTRGEVEVEPRQVRALSPPASR